jgi:DNA integrity scanning protein DisA with diadenylate cyclase activity
VLRHATVSTQENRRITSGVLVRAEVDDPPLAAGGPRLQLAWPLRSWKTLHRLCDGVRTLATVDSCGHLVSVLDVGSAGASGAAATPYPVASGQRAHACATLDGRGVCLVLTANGSIQVFAHGVQVFSFEQGRWRLRNTGDKLIDWQQNVGDAALATRLLTTALDLSERRVGGMFVVLDDGCDEAGLVSASDQLTTATASISPAQPLHYLFRGANVLRMPDGVVENAASIDGAVVLRRNGDLVAVGAILRSDGGLAGIEGARTTAAVAASTFGAVLKISEDGEIAAFRNRVRQWSL